MPSSLLGDILISAGKLTRGQLEEAVQEQSHSGRLLGDALVELGHVTAEDVARALARQLRIPYLELDDDFRLEREEIRLIPETLARKFCLIPVRKHHDPSVTIVMKDPLDMEAVDTVQSLTKLEVHKAVSTEKRIQRMIDKYYREDAHIETTLKEIIDLEARSDPDAELDIGADAERLRVQANDAPVVRFVNLLLMEAVRDRASDIHFEPGEGAARVRIRIDGRLREVTPPPWKLYPAVVTRIKILSDMDIAEKRLPLDGRFKFRVQDRVVDVRVSSLPEVFGEKVVLRLLDRSSLVVDMGEIGFDTGTIQRFERVLCMPHGIILLTGPTGSGKTTTLYSALSFLRSPEKNIQTVEDPVEYLLPGINQMPIRPKIGLDFANALRSILRQDPDIIMIGEIRDLETARIAMRASLTGHLVLSTLHTNDAPSAFSRLKDIGIERYLIAATVNLVIAQRLVRTICLRCREEDTPGPDVLTTATAVNPEAAAWRFMHGRGCAECGNTGFRGRKAISEFLEATNAVRRMVLDGTGEAALKQRVVEQGMKTLLQSGFNAVRDGLTTAEEVLSVCPLVQE